MEDNNSKYTKVKSLLITRLTKSMSDIEQDYKQGKKSHCYGWWASPNCAKSAGQGEKFELKDTADRKRFYNDPDIQKLLAHSLLYMSCMDISGHPADPVRFKQCLKLAYKYSKDSSENVTLPNGKDITWGELITKLYNYHVIDGNACAARTLDLPLSNNLSP